MIIGVLVAVSTGTGCAAVLSTATRHEIGAGVGFMGSDERPEDEAWTMNDATEWTAN